MVAIFLKTNNNKLRTQLSKSFLFSLTAARVARRCRGFVFTKFQGKRMKQIPMTVRGAELLRQELDFLKNERRPEIIKAIAVSTMSMVT